MNFLGTLLERLKSAGDAPVIQEIYVDRLETASGKQLLELMAKARAYIQGSGLKKGDRCAILGPNSIRWAAVDLALMAEGIIVVPLYARQVPAELVAMMKDCTPPRLLCSDGALRDSITSIWPQAPTAALFDDVFSAAGIDASPPLALTDDEAVPIIYTSGTSGEPKGLSVHS